MYSRPSGPIAGSSVIARWLPPGFKDGLDPDSTEGAIDLVYDLPNFRVEYVRVEPPGIPTAFWRSVGPSHNVFVTESFIDEMAAATKQDAVAYRRALLDKLPRAKAVLDLAAEKAGWGQALPKGSGRGVALQFVFGSYQAQVAEVEVLKEGTIRVRRVVCAVDCGTVVNPDTVEAQIQSGIIFGTQGTASIRSCPVFSTSAWAISSTATRSRHIRRAASSFCPAIRGTSIGQNPASMSRR
jgi:isoquinoline 1-oxidoreductase beta subunit